MQKPDSPVMIYTIFKGYCFCHVITYENWSLFYLLLFSEPRYANSIECAEDSTCLCGDGSCYQKVVYFTFQQSQGINSDTGNETWTTFQQPLNVSCECQVLDPSSMMTLLSSYETWCSGFLFQVKPKILPGIF